MGTITLRRTGRKVNHQGATGEISELEVGGETLWAVERRDGYVTLPEGTYTVQMELSPTRQGRRQLRVLGHDKKTKQGEVARILIHAANTPDEVQGCIAPGLYSTTSGVSQSQAAMNKIFHSLGEFKVGQTGELVVTHK